MWEYNYSDELYHHGVKGMKWGVRRKSRSSSNGSGKKSKTKNWSEDAKTASNIKKKNVKEMSNTELRKLNERSRLEQEYSRLNPSTVKKGMAFATGTAALTSTALNLYNNSDKIIAIGKKFINR